MSRIGVLEQRASKLAPTRFCGATFARPLPATSPQVHRLGVTLALNPGRGIAFKQGAATTGRPTGMPPPRGPRDAVGTTPGRHRAVRVRPWPCRHRVALCEQHAHRDLAGRRSRWLKTTFRPGAWRRPGTAASWSARVPCAAPPRLRARRPAAVLWPAGARPRLLHGALAAARPQPGTHPAPRAPLGRARGPVRARERGGEGARSR
jgi:hypothetical protein